MYSSSIKSYSEEFNKRKALERVEHGTLLTDRNAYVNFLEMQLERVTAACMGVESYNQKFTDMQQMIVGLEQRCSSTTRLVSLAQQCTEELRSNVFVEMEKLTHRLNAQYAEINKSVQILGNKVITLEANLNKLSEWPEKVILNEKEIVRINKEIHTAHQENDQNNKKFDQKCDDLKTITDDCVNKIAFLHTANSKASLEVSEVERKCHNIISNLESKVYDSCAVDRDEFARKLHSVSAKIAADISTVEKDVQNREMKILNAFKSDLKVVHSDLSDINKELREAITQNTAKVHTEMLERFAALVRDTEDKFTAVTSSLTASSESLLEFESDCRKQLLSSSNEIKSLQKSHADSSEAISSLKSGLSDVTNEMAIDKAHISEIIDTLIQQKSRPAAPSVSDKKTVVPVTVSHSTPAESVHVSVERGRDHSARYSTHSNHSATHVNSVTSNHKPIHWSHYASRPIIRIPNTLKQKGSPDSSITQKDSISLSEVDKYVKEQIRIALEEKEAARLREQSALDADKDALLYVMSSPGVEKCLSDDHHTPQSAVSLKVSEDIGSPPLQQPSSSDPGQMKEIFKQFLDIYQKDQNSLKESIRVLANKEVATEPRVSRTNVVPITSPPITETVPTSTYYLSRQPQPWIPNSVPDYSQYPLARSRSPSRSHSPVSRDDITRAEINKVIESREKRSVTSEYADEVQSSKSSNLANYIDNFISKDRTRSYRPANHIKGSGMHVV